jgi:hypothetical protein
MVDNATHNATEWKAKLGGLPDRRNGYDSNKAVAAPSFPFKDVPVTKKHFLEINLRIALAETGRFGANVKLVPTKDKNTYIVMGLDHTPDKKLDVTGIDLTNLKKVIETVRPEQLGVEASDVSRTLNKHFKSEGYKTTVKLRTAKDDSVTLQVTNAQALGLDFKKYLRSQQQQQKQ